MTLEAWAGREAWTWQKLLVLFKKGLLNLVEIGWRGLMAGAERSGLVCSRAPCCVAGLPVVQWHCVPFSGSGAARSFLDSWQGLLIILATLGSSWTPGNSGPS